MSELEAPIFQVDEIRFPKLLHGSADMDHAKTKCIAKHFLRQRKRERPLCDHADHRKPVVQLKKKMSHPLIGVIAAKTQDLISSES